MGDGEYPLSWEFFENLGLEEMGDPNKHVMITESEYVWMRNQIKMYHAVSDKLFKEFYGPDYYFTDPLSPPQVYYETVNDVVKYLNHKKQNIFKRIWQKITKW